MKNTNDKYLIWIDTETGGLNDEIIELKKPIIINDIQINHVAGSQYYPLLEIGVIITDYNFNEIATYESTIHCSEERLNKMHEWAIKQHKESGLWEKCLNENKILQEVGKEFYHFLKKYNIKNSPMCGNSVQFDKDFLNNQLPFVMQTIKNEKILNHRNFDVSGLLEVLKDSHPNLLEKFKEIKTTTTHRAIEDIRKSIEYAKIYKKDLFKDDISSEIVIKHVLNHKISKNL